MKITELNKLILCSAVLFIFATDLIQSFSYDGANICFDLINVQKVTFYSWAFIFLNKF